MPVRFERVKVTKRLARLLLGINVEYNRNPKMATKVEEYKTDMDNGDWDTNTGEVIKITGEIVDGEPTKGTKLIDGQNRLLAFQASQLTYLWFDFAFNVPEKAFEVIDSGAARTFADMSKKYNVGSERNVNGAVVRRVTMWEKGTRLSGRGGVRANRPTKRQLLHRWQEDVEGFDTATRRGLDISQARMGQAGVAGSAFYLFSKIDKDAAHTYFDQVLTGANLAEKSPALWLNKKLLKDRLFLSPDEQMVLWVKTWNMFRKDELVDRTISIVGFRGRPYTNDTFPVPE